MKKRGIILTVLAALIYGFTPILCFYTYNMGNNSFTLTFFRNFFCVFVLFIIMQVKKIDFKLTWNEFKNIFMVAFVGMVITTLLLYSSYNYIGVSTATTLHFLYPVFVMLICRFYYKDIIQNNQKLALMLSFVGILFFIDLNELNYINGVIMALLSGITYAVYLVLIEKTKLSYMNSFKLSFYLTLTVSIILFLINLKVKQLILKQPIESFILMLVVALLASFLAVIFLKEGIKSIGSNKASVYCLFEPISSVFFEAILINESLTFNKLMGCGFIIGGMYYLSKKHK